MAPLSRLFCKGLLLTGEMGPESGGSQSGKGPEGRRTLCLSPRGYREEQREAGLKEAPGTGSVGGPVGGEVGVAILYFLQRESLLPAVFSLSTGQWGPERGHHAHEECFLPEVGGGRSASGGCRLCGL